MDHQTWRRNAKCKDLTAKQADTLFFVEKSGRTNRAKVFCSDCNVKFSCLAFAIFYNEEGTWAGLSKKERGVIQKLGKLPAEVIAELRRRDIRENSRVRRLIQKSIPQPLQAAPLPRYCSQERVDSITQVEIEEAAKLAEELLAAL